MSQKALSCFGFVPDLIAGFLQMRVITRLNQISKESCTDHQFSSVLFTEGYRNFSVERKNRFLMKIK
jgi:hypothetical protein